MLEPVPFFMHSISSEPMHQIQLLKKYGLSIRGFRGQHLLVDENIQRKIVEFVKVEPGEKIVEIGPGLGAITELLLDKGARVVAVEKDRKFVEILECELGKTYENLKLVSGDILKFDFEKCAKNERLKVVGNIPYYITTDIILFLIKNRKWIDSAYLTMQKEYADRIFAQPGSKSYSRLTLLVRFYADICRGFEISRTCFTPPPDVDSTTISFTFWEKPPVDIDEELLFQVIQSGFSSRRKNILNTLSAGFEGRLTKEKVKNVLDSCGIDLNARAESLMLKDFIRLAEHIGKVLAK